MRDRHAAETRAILMNCRTKKYRARATTGHELRHVDCGIGNGRGHAPSGGRRRNVANVRSAGPLASAGGIVTASFPAAFTPWRVDQVEVSGGGTDVRISAVTPGQTPEYDPGAPYADQNGLVAAPNVDLAGEVVEALIARYAFAFNAKVMRTASDMTKSFLDITA